MTGLRRLFLLTLVLLCVGSLTSCGYTSEQDVNSFIESERLAVRPAAKPLPPPKTFAPVAYEAQGLRDPFNRVLFAQSLMVLAKDAKPTLATPEFLRTKEPLEQFALESMTLVGVLKKEGRSVALVRVDGKLHQVAPGNHLGQNFGKVTKVEESQVTLREVVQNEVGEWVARQTTLKLQERSK
jgi:type IV pilus assembly protein PilP